jgi:hypothetical protein
MAMLAARVGHALTPNPRSAAQQQPVPNGTA